MYTPTPLITALTFWLAPPPTENELQLSRAELVTTDESVIGGTDICD